jgi:hypothetical protein
MILTSRALGLQTSAQQDAVDARKEVLVYIQRLETAHALSHSQQSMITVSCSANGN